MPSSPRVRRADLPDPDTMTPAARRAEVATILASGFLRLRLKGADGRMPALFWCGRAIEAPREVRGHSTRLSDGSPRRGSPTDREPGGVEGGQERAPDELLGIPPGGEAYGPSLWTQAWAWSSLGCMMRCSPARIQR